MYVIYYVLCYRYKDKIENLRYSNIIQYDMKSG